MVKSPLLQLQSMDTMPQLQGEMLMQPSISPANPRNLDVAMAENNVCIFLSR